jgi:hypothetical protein
VAKIPISFPLGKKEDLTIEKLYEIIEDMYRDLALAINKKPDIHERSTDGQTSDSTLSNGDVNINTSTGKVEMLIKHTDSSTVVWKEI